MDRNPRGDKVPPQVDRGEPAAWGPVLAHRRKDDPATVAAAIERFEAAGVTPAEVHSHLQDGGDRLYAAAVSGAQDWATAFGGPRAVALLAAEVGALMSHLVARAAYVRSLSVDALLDEFSAVTVAGELGVARQKVYELARVSATDPDFITTTPGDSHERHARSSGPA